MIEEEILEILGDATDNGERINEVADQFRDERNVRELVVLLDSNHAGLVSIGAWILSEVPFDLYNSDSFILRLRRLLDHADPSVRFHALSALFPALNPQDVDTQELLRKLRNDPNEGVRKAAEAASARLSLK